jgi:hypothetical protein
LPFIEVSCKNPLRFKACEFRDMYRPRANTEDELCPPCQVAYDTQPLGALVRRWNADFADGDGRQSGLLCERCKATVRARHERSACGGLLSLCRRPPPRVRRSGARCCMTRQTRRASCPRPRSAQLRGSGARPDRARTRNRWARASAWVLIS